MNEFTLAAPAKTLGNIVHDRTSGSSHLIFKPKITCNGILECQRVKLLTKLAGQPSNSSNM